MQPSPSPARVIEGAVDVDRRLDDLQIRRRWCVEAVLRGDFERQSTSTLEFDGAAAYKAASIGLAAFRSHAMDEGWFSTNYLGIQVAIRGDHGCAVAVTEGDHRTGIIGDHDPATKALKGPNTRRATDSMLFDADDAVDLYYLLTYSLGGVLRAELASPRPGSDGRVTGWFERILLGDIPVDGGAGGRSRSPAPEPIVTPPIHLPRKNVG